VLPWARAWEASPPAHNLARLDKASQKCGAVGHRADGGPHSAHEVDVGELPSPPAWHPQTLVVAQRVHHTRYTYTDNATSS